MNGISTKIKPYQPHDEATVISCYFNSQKYQSRARNFEVFYRQLKRSNVNYLIAECAFGDEAFELPDDPRIVRLRSKHPLWQKEVLLNTLVKRLPSSCRYVFWLDADVLFTNPNWMVKAVELLKTRRICQPFSIAVRLKKDEVEPAFEAETELKRLDSLSSQSNERNTWRSFAYNFAENPKAANSSMFDVHGHTGFAWGARREVLEAAPLFDRAIVGTADHIIAHAAVGQIPSECVEKAFTDLKARNQIYDWSRNFNRAAANSIGYVSGELWHLWHGELQNRRYLPRTRELSEMDFDLDDLKTNQDGLYEIPEHKKGVIEWISDYFFSRKEDEIAFDIDSGNETLIEQERSDYSEPTYSEPFNLPDEPFGGNPDFAGGGAGGSWENYS